MGKESGITLADKKVTTPRFRVSFPKVFKAEGYKGGEPKFSVTMLFDKKIDLSKPLLNKEGKQVSISLKQAVRNATIEAYGVDPSKWPTKKIQTESGKIKVVSALKMPFRDGDIEKDEGMDGYKGCIFVGASAKADKQPQVIDQNQDLITDSKLFYAGCYARATLIAFHYDVNGNKGISFALCNLKKIGEGKKFSGRKDAVEDFDSITDLDEELSEGEGVEELEEEFDPLA